MIKPPFLVSGDTVAIVAPGRKAVREDIDFASVLFESWGLKALTGKNLFTNSHSYLSGSDKERCEDLQFALNDSTVKCIVCARGGFGTTRILDKLDFSSFAKNPKWIVGFSDITALHLKLIKLGVESIHATMPVLFSKPEAQSSVQSLKEILFGRGSSIPAKHSNLNRYGKATGPIMGGNLSLVVDSLGTDSEPDTKGKILVLEEVDEYRYKLDRMMTHLGRAGKLQGLAGLVIGHMTNISDSETIYGESAEEIISRVVSQYTYPVAFGFPIGHENPNLAWAHGATVSLDVTQQESLLMPLR